MKKLLIPLFAILFGLQMGVMFGQPPTPPVQSSSQPEPILTADQQAAVQDLVSHLDDFRNNVLPGIITNLKARIVAFKAQNPETVKAFKKAVFEKLRDYVHNLFGQTKKNFC